MAITIRTGTGDYSGPTLCSILHAQYGSETPSGRVSLFMSRRRFEGPTQINEIELRDGGALIMVPSSSARSGLGWRAVGVLYSIGD